MDRIILTKDINIINKYLKKLDTKLITKEDLESDIHSFIVYKKDDNEVALAGYSIYYDRAEIDYLYVDKRYRNQKIGKKMLNHIIKECENRCYNITLEVRINNEIAINFYEKLGFKKGKTISDYYKNEDALLMIKELDKNERCIYTSN